MEICGDFDVEPCTKRSFCSHCERAQSVCLCSYFPSPKVVSKVHVIIIMHPKELERKCTTGLLAKLSLKKCDIIVGRDFDKLLSPESQDRSSSILRKALSNSSRTCVLFPCEEAVDLSVQDSSVDGTDSHGESNTSDRTGTTINLWSVKQSVEYLIVFDGTWQFAREMYEKNHKYLINITKVAFKSPLGDGLGGASEFVIRVEPSEICGSTLEAIVNALICLDPDVQPSKDKLLAPLRQMIHYQQVHVNKTHTLEDLHQSAGRLNMPIQEPVDIIHVKKTVPYRQRPWAGKGVLSSGNGIAVRDSR